MLQPEPVEGHSPHRTCHPFTSAPRSIRTVRKSLWPCWSADAIPSSTSNSAPSEKCRRRGCHAGPRCHHPADSSHGHGGCEGAGDQCFILSSRRCPARRCANFRRRSGGSSGRTPAPARPFYSAKLADRYPAGRSRRPGYAALHRQGRASRQPGKNSSLRRLHGLCGRRDRPSAPDVGHHRSPHEPGQQSEGCRMGRQNRRPGLFCLGLRPGDRVVHCLNYSCLDGGVTDHLALEAAGPAWSRSGWATPGI